MPQASTLRFKRREARRPLESQLQEHKVMAAAVDNPHETMRDLLMGDLFLFLQYFWDEYSQDAFKPNWHIKYICQTIQRAAERVAEGLPKEHDIIINVPPGSTKTAIVSIMFPLWCWCRWFHMRFITASYTFPLSLESAEYSRDIMKSDKFRTLFPELDIKQDKDQKSNFRIIKYKTVSAGRPPRQIKGGNRFSTSVGGSVTGFHGHINIVDDPIDPLRAVSPAEIQKANFWMDNVLPFRKVDKAVTLTILIMQRLHQDDPTGHWLKKKSAKLLHICIPGEIRNYKDKVKPKELIENYVDDLMDPVRMSWESLNVYLELGQFTYGGQVGQDPIPLGGGMFKVDAFSVLDRMPSEHRIVRTIRYWDKAATEGGDGAFTAGVKMHLLTDGTFLVSDVKRGRWGTDERERRMLQTAQADGKKVYIYVEQEPGSGGKDSAKATIKNLSGFSVRADRPTGDKTFRADPYSVQVNEGNVKLLAGAWNEAYIEELKYFPGSTHRDQADASSGAFNLLTGKKKVKVGR